MQATPSAAPPSLPPPLMSVRWVPLGKPETPDRLQLPHSTACELLPWLECRNGHGLGPEWRLAAAYGSDAALVVLVGRLSVVAALASAVMLFRVRGRIRRSARIPAME